MKKLTPQLLLIVAFLLITSSLALGQGTTSRVAGIVRDANGGTIAGATVTLMNEATSISFTAETSESGAYAFDLVQVGNYSLTVEKQGFKRYLSKSNAINVNQPTTINVSLEPGGVAETVIVQASGEQVQTSTSGNIGSTIEQRTLEALPIVGTRGRNPLDLLNFQPGVVIGGNTGGAVNVNGSRDRAFNFTLDGIDINESTAGGSNFTPLRPNPDSVQEFQVVTSNFTAELGRSSGAQVTLVTKSGSNQFHGNIFEYYRTPRLDAKSYPVTIAKAPKDQFVQHIFGGSIGGPLLNPGFGEGGRGAHWMRDKAFFFVNLQLLRAYDTALVSRTVYTQAARQGLFRYVVGRANSPANTGTASVDTAGNPVLPPCVGTPPTNAPCISSYNIATNPAGISLDPTLTGVLNSMPLPNNFSGVTGCSPDGLNTACFNFASPQHERQHDFVTKLDFNLSQNSLLYFRYAEGAQNSLGDSANGGRPIFPASPNLVDTFRSPKNLAVNWRWSPKGTVTNEAIFGVSKFRFSFATPTPDPTFLYSIFPTESGTTGISAPNLNFTYNARGVRTLQLIDNLTSIHGSHTLKTGTNLRFNRHTDDRSNVGGTQIEPFVTLNQSGGFGPFNLPASGATSINATDLTRLQNTVNNLLGRVNTVSQAFVSDPANPSGFAPAGTRWINIAEYTELDFYFQDNWRFKSNLTLDLGLRWEVKLPPSVDGRPILVPNQSVKLGAAPSNTLKWVQGDLFKTANVFMPSLGFAWDPFKSGKTSLRGNYRIASDRIATFLFGSSIFQGTPGNNIGVTNSTFGQGGGLYRNLGPVIAALVPTTPPSSLRQPASFGTGSINVIDPDLKFPQVHEWSLSFQREIGKNVVEVNYIGKHAVHLLGGYNVNQADIFASVPGVAETNFLDAFNRIRANAAYNSPLINLIMTGNSANNGGTARFRALNTTQISQGSVGAAALTTSQRTCQAAEVTAGVCTNAQLNQRLMDLAGFPFLLQPYPQFTGGLNVFDSSDYSNYRGLQMILKRRINTGLGFQFGYTLSKSKDNRSWDPSLSTVSTGSVQSASSTPFDLRDRRLNYTWSDFDRRHVFQGTYTYELPVGKARSFASDAPKILDLIIGGWQTSGTVLLASGRPFTVFSGINTVSSVVQSTADCSACTRNSGQLVLESDKNFWFDAATRAQFTAPAPGSIGNTGRNFFLAPHYFQWDASLSKKFKINETLNFDLRFDARNVLNNPSFDNPTALITSGTFGRINDTVTNNARRIQVSGKLNF